MRGRSIGCAVKEWDVSVAGVTIFDGYNCINDLVFKIELLAENLLNPI